MPAPGLLWFRRDLRLADNPALNTLAGAGPVIPVYIHVPAEEAPWAPSAASRWWLHHALEALDTELRDRGLKLVIRHGKDSLALLRGLVRETGARRVAWNRLYEPAVIARDRRIKQALRDDGLEVSSHNAALLREPWTVGKQDGGSYRAFTPFWRTLRAADDFPPPTPCPDMLTPPGSWPPGDGLHNLELLPRVRWDRAFHHHWMPGERGARRALSAFVRRRLDDYRNHRDLPAIAGTSELSPHLHVGSLGPRQVVAALRERRTDAETYLSELGWREFAHHLLYHHPEMPEEPLDRRFRHFPWADAGDALRAWQRGETGIPMVDAGMRQLWTTGWMHNRVRMVAGSLLTKNLRVPWQTGEAWFWDTLVDADLASNSMGWQWIQGCGADAAPYFRIFNPVRQGMRFDPAGDYVRQWLPELARLPAHRIHAPWEAGAGELRDAGVRLGRDYPHPVVDLSESRKQALDAYDTIKSR